MSKPFWNSSVIQRENEYQSFRFLRDGSCVWNYGSTFAFVLLCCLKLLQSVEYHPGASYTLLLWYIWHPNFYANTRCFTRASTRARNPGYVEEIFQGKCTVTRPGEHAMFRVRCPKHCFIQQLVRVVWPHGSFRRLLGVAALRGVSWRASESDKRHLQHEPYTKFQ